MGNLIVDQAVPDYGAKTVNIAHVAMGMSHCPPGN